MTLETCYKKLELAKTPKEKKIWEERISKKLLLPQYLKEKSIVEKPKEVAKIGKTSKR